MTPTHDPAVPESSSLMDDPDAARDPSQAIDYSEAAGDVVDPVRPDGQPLDELPIAPKEDAFRGFMSISRYGGAVIALIVFWAVMLFALGVGGTVAALTTLGLGLLLAPALKLRGAFVPLLIVACLVLGIGTALFSGSPDNPDVDEVIVENTED